MYNYISHVKLFLDAGVSDVYKQDFENPYQQLFLWSVLMNRQELAKLFWKQGKVTQHLPHC